MLFNTYGDLKSAVAQWLNRKDLTERIPDFIKLAETKMFRVIRAPANETSVIYKTGAGDTTIVIPADLVELKLLLINEEPYKFIPQNEFYSRTRPSDSTLFLEGTRAGDLTHSRYFTRIRNIYVLPTPLQGDEEITLTYYADWGGMNDDEDFNAVLRSAPDLYLYGALIEAEPFIKNDDRMAVWKRLYDDSLAAYLRHTRTLDYGANAPEVLSGDF